MSFEWRDTVLHSILSHKRMHVSLQYSVFIILLNEVLNSFLYINESEYTKYSYYVNCRRKYETVIFLLISLLLLKLISQWLLLLMLTFDINFIFPTQILTARLKNSMAQALTLIGKYRCGGSLNTWMTTFLSFLHHRTFISTFCILIKLLSFPLPTKTFE